MRQNRKSAAPCNYAARDHSGDARSSHNIFSSLKRAMESTLASSLEYGQLGRLLGVPRTTAWRWCNECDTEQVPALFQLLERLRPELRHKVIDQFCRDYPRFAHEKLSHDQDAIAALKQLLADGPGLSVIQGEPEHMAAFVATALAHEYPRLLASNPEIAGIDVRPPTHFVPVPGIRYPKGNVFGNGATADFVREAWSQIRISKASLVFLIGALPVTSEMRSEILAMSRDHHVVVTGTSLEAAVSGGHQFPCRLRSVRVSPVKGHDSLIRVRVDSLRSRNQ